ncbi:MAG: hypothetical protein L6Q92_00690 [Phycisphaerae bacterium]|nr:hypothetical protein [Phycisphaerae bacterium]
MIGRSSCRRASLATAARWVVAILLLAATLQTSACRNDRDQVNDHQRALDAEED